MTPIFNWINKMSKNTLINLCLHSESIGLASRTLEICKKYTSSDIDNDAHEIVFVYNHEGQYFRVYDNIQNLLAFNTSASQASFDTEDDLAAYLSGEAVVSSTIIDSSPTVINKIPVGRWDLPKYVAPIACGAECKIQYLDKGDTANVYISFCPNGGSHTTDSFGVQDSHIFYYAVRGESEIKELMADGCSDIFKILNFKLTYINTSSNDDVNYEIEITDNRKSSGQLNVDVSAIGGNMDDMLCTTFEINKLPGDDSTQCLHLSFDGDNQAASFFKKGDSYIIRPENNVFIRPYLLNDYSMGYVLEAKK